MRELKKFTGKVWRLAWEVATVCSLSVVVHDGGRHGILGTNRAAYLPITAKLEDGDDDGIRDFTRLPVVGVAVRDGKSWH
jgi:hypothetical protein